MNVRDALAGLEAAAIPTIIRENGVLFPSIETVHVLAVVLVVGTIAIVDLRLIGLPAHRDGVRKLMADVLPWTWGLFVLAVITGGLLFSTAATKYFDNLPFRLKMLGLLSAGLNMVFFHAVTYRSVGLWDEFVSTPFAAKIAGSTSICLWLAIIVAGRWIGFTLI